MQTWVVSNQKVIYFKETEKIKTKKKIKRERGVKKREDFISYKEKWRQKREIKRKMKRKENKEKMVRFK